MKIFSRILAAAGAVLVQIASVEAAPSIVAINPPAGAVVSNLAQITVTFSTAVAGVQASDLQINDQPAVSRSGSNAVATFHFSQPAPGLVTVNFDNDATITDQGGSPFDPLAASAAWTYTLADLGPPVVAVAEPAAGAVVGALGEIEVVFSEPVTGVDASDFRVNGNVASSVTAVAPDRYRFAFAQPAAGAVTITWTTGHGIQDLSPAANAFGGVGWNYMMNAAAASGDVVINEFLAENRNSLEDFDGQKEDWIELRNRGANSVNLTGWSLTDDPAQPGKWVFPNITLGAGQYLIVFASAKDRKTTVAGATNHTNFRLNLTGGYLGLFNSTFPRMAVSQFAAYPEQRADISYGLTAGGAATYFAALTPRAANNDASAVTGFVQPPHASVKSGLFNQPFNLHLSTETPGAQVRYTLDGSVPTTASPLYTGPLNIAGVPAKAVVMVRAVGFKTGQVPSSVMTRTYIFPDHVLTQPANPVGFPTIWDSPCTTGLNCNDINPADYEMDPQVITNVVDNYRALARQGLLSLPTVSIVTDVNLLFSAAQGVYVRREPTLRKPASAEYITADGTEGFQIDCGLEMQGQTSPDDSTTGGSKWKSLKLGLRLFFQGEFGPTKLNYKVFEDSPVESFDTLLLAGGHNNYWNYNNNDTQRTRALYVRDQYVANLQNAMGGRSHHGRFVHLYLNGLYWGLYFIHERPDASFQASYYGGEKEDYDVFKHDSGQVVDGSNSSYSAMWSTINAGLGNNANYEALQQQLDVPGLIDYLLINFWCNNTDWDHKNLYASHRKPGGLWRFHAWDSEHVAADSDFAVLDDNNGTNPTAVFRRLLVNAEFRILLADQIHKHMFNGGIFYTDPANPIYNPTFPERNRPAHLFMKMLQDIDTAIVCESARWGDVGPGRESNPHTRNVSFYEERDVVMGYRPTFGSHSTFNFSTRSSGLLNQFRTRGWYPNVVAPVFNQHGGRVAAGFNLTMTAPAGTLYYTTNGADPRVYGSAAVSPHARSYSGTPVAVNSTMQIKARSLVGTNWSALNEATFVVAELVTSLRLSEIMYNPIGGDAFEFIELLNAGPTDLNLTGHTFEGINYIFPPGFILASGARIVLASDTSPASFAARYPGVAVADYFGGALANGGERLAVKDPAGNFVLSVDYDDENGWPTSPDGGGYSLEMSDVNGDPDDPANWRASNAPNGTPGQVASPPGTGSIVLNEVLAENLTVLNNGGTFPDWVELRNVGLTAVDLTGWSLSDNGNPRRFVFSSGPVISSGGYLVVFCDTNGAAPGLHTGFALDRDGGSLFLYDANTNRIDAVSLGAQVADYAVGRVGPEWQLTTPTPGALNAAAATATQSNLTLNEWLANSAPGGSDWLELYNRSVALPVALKGVYLGTSNTIFQIRSLSFLAPAGFIQLFADESPGNAHLDFKLPAAGGAIVLYDIGTTEINRVSYGSQAQGVTQGRLPNGSDTITLFPGSASPAASNYALSYSGPFLNEVLARNESALSSWGEYADWIEIANTNAGSVSLAGLGLSDSPETPMKWVFPSGTTLGGNSYLRVWCDGSHAASISPGADLNTGFSISANGGGVYLSGTNGVLIDSVEFGFQVADLSIGRSAGQWRLLAAPTPGTANSAAATLGTTAGLRLNEWMTDPANGADWFELYSTAASPVALTGLYLTDDPSISGTNLFQVGALSFIGANGFVKWEADETPSDGANHVNFSLNAAGDALRLYGADLELIDAADFGPLPTGASGGRFPDGAAAFTQFSTTPSPGESNYLPLSGAVVNEALTHTDPPLEDAIELFNPSGQPSGIGGFYLSDSRRNFKKYRIADGTTIPAGGFIAFYENQFNSGGAGSFALNSARGGVVYLSEADGSGNLTSYRSVMTFGAAKNGASFGRYPTSVHVDFPAMSARSFGMDSPTSLAQFRTGTGATNPTPSVGPVVINEIMYHPVSGVGTNAAEDGNEEFVELHNITGASVAFFDPAFPANTWRLRGGIEFDFPGGVSLPARSYLLLVHFNPATDGSALANFRSKYGVALNVPILGPFTGRLDNRSESVELYLPDTPQGPGPDQGYVPFVLVDQVAYGDADPWPAEADGSGASLQRRRPYNYGNDPVNWKSLGATAGRANVSGSDYVDTDSDGLPDSWEQANGLALNNAADAGLDSDGDSHNNLEEYHDSTNPQSAASRLDAPVISGQPQSQSVTPGATVVFTVDLSGAEALQKFTPSGEPEAFRYQWRLNGLPLPGETNSTLTLIGVSAASSGFYDVVVWNGAGFGISQAAKLTVLIPPNITLQPQQQVVNPGASATFTVTATGTGQLRYQWRLNNAELPGETGASLTVANAQLANEGEYTVRVSDDVASLASAGARLVVRVLPTIVAPPQNITNGVGSTVTFTITCSGSIPMTFFWRKGAIGIVTNVVFGTSDSLTLTNVQLTDSAQYRVIVTNSAIATLTTNATAFLQVLLSPRFQDMQVLPDGSASMRVSGTTNRTYAIETSSTLSNWTILTNFFYTNGLMPFIDPTTSSVSNRFYRARVN